MSEETKTTVSTPDEDHTFTAADVQAWVDGLDGREAAMLAHVVDTHSLQACLSMLDAMAEWTAELAHKHANAGNPGKSKAVREVIGTILHVKRDTETQARAIQGFGPETMQ